MKREIVTFNGSSTHAGQIKRWILEGGEPPTGDGIHTMDIRPFTIEVDDTLYTVNPSEKICKVSQTVLGATYFLIGYKDEE